MGDIKRRVDTWSMAVMLIASVLFVVALFLKGLSHDVLLEAGVFLISVKLIIMACRNSVIATDLKDRLDDMQSTLTRMEESLPRRTSQVKDVPAKSQTPRSSVQAHRT